MPSETVDIRYRERAALAHELIWLEERHSPEDREIFKLILLVVCGCALIILPYRSIFIPRPIMFGIGFFALVVFMPKIFSDHEKIIYMMLAYLPFKKVIAGTLGHFLAAFNATNILLILVFVGWSTYQQRHNQPLFRTERLDPLLLLFMLFSFLSLIRGFMLTQHRPPIDVIFQLKRWYTPMLLYFIITNNLRTIRQGYIAFWNFSISTGIIGFLGLKEYYMDRGGWGGGGRIEKMRISVTSGPNHLGYLFCCYVWFLLALWLYNFKRDRRYWLLWIPILACLQSMRLTFSRGAQIGLLSGAWFFCWSLGKKWGILMTAVIAFVAINPAVIPPQLMGRLAHTFIRSEGTLEERLDKSSANRIDIWRGGLEMIRDYPLQGVGYGNFPHYIGRYAPGMARKDAHNTYLIIACEMGLPALGVFLLFMLLAWWTALYVHRYCGNDRYMKTISLGYLCMMPASLVSNLFGTRFDSNEVVVQFFTMTAIMGCFATIIKKRQAFDREEQLFPDPPPEPLWKKKADSEETSAAPSVPDAQ